MIRKTVSQAVVRIALVVIVFYLFWMPPAIAGPLSDRIGAFPNWRTKPALARSNQDLRYPAWMEGTWEVKSTLLEMVAPLAPDIVTPGFESNRPFINQPIAFNVRFTEKPVSRSIVAQLKSTIKWTQTEPEIIADRAFNGLNIARAYLGNAVLSVKVDPNSPNKQITFLKDDYQLTSNISGRATEIPNPEEFITSEIFQQVFRGVTQPYLNEVETTTAYKYSSNRSPNITANQITAIYLSPQDPQYFKAGSTPVALYRYGLEFSPADVQALHQE